MQRRRDHEARHRPATGSRDAASARAADLAWQRKLIAAELRGIERGLIRASRGPGTR